MAGILSHIFWDSFTHEYGFMVRHLALLRMRPLLEYGSARPVSNLLQHLSTVFGTVVVIIAYRRWSNTAAPGPVPATLRLSPRFKSIVITGIASIAALLGMGFAYEDSSRFSRFVVNGTISFTSLALLGLIVFSIYWHRGAGSGASRSQTG